LLSLAEGLARLTEKQRTAVELHFLSGLSVPDVAQQMGQSTVSVTGLLYWGMKALRETMPEPT
jgi:DNA-directed RNA polymerase specialized sigma24 family protein